MLGSLLIKKVYNSAMQLLGLHHVSAIASSREECREFYGGLLGLESATRPGADELSFGTGPEQGGGVLSFEARPGVAAGSPGRGLVHRLQWSVSSPAALEHWRQRLEGAGIN